MWWTLLIVVLIGSGAFAILDAPARARRHAAEQQSVLCALAALQTAGTVASITREIARGTVVPLHARVVAAHLAALEEDGFVAAQKNLADRRAETNYLLLASAPDGPVRAEACALTVYHDGSCPLCAAEISHYRRARGAGAVRFIDVADPAEAAGPDLTREGALARFHVRDTDGALLSGASAFATLWETLPGWRWLGRLVGTWPVLPLAELAYRAFLPMRPHLARVLVACGVLSAKDHDTPSRAP